jgi:hypothetical protein
MGALRFVKIAFRLGIASHRSLRIGHGSIVAVLRSDGHVLS